MKEKDIASEDQVPASIPEVSEELPGEVGEETVPSEEPVSEVSTPETIKLGDQEYPIDQVQEALQKARDYDYLLPEFTKVTQRLAVLEKSREGTSQSPTVEENELRKAAGLLTPYIQQTIGKDYVSRIELNQMQEDQRLSSTLQSLEEKYDGIDGSPKFDRRKVLEYCVSHGLPDPEAGYKLLNEVQLKEWYARQGKTAPSAPLSATGEGVPREPVGKKRVFGLPENPDQEVPIREAIEETLQNLGQ